MCRRFRNLLKATKYCKERTQYLKTIWMIISTENILIMLWYHLKQGSSEIIFRRIIWNIQPAYCREEWDWYIRWGTTGISHTHLGHFMMKGNFFRGWWFIRSKNFLCDLSPYSSSPYNQYGEVETYKKGSDSVIFRLHNLVPIYFIPFSCVDRMTVSKSIGDSTGKFLNRRAPCCRRRLSISSWLLTIQSVRSLKFNLSIECRGFIRSGNSFPENDFPSGTWDSET